MENSDFDLVCPALRRDGDGLYLDDGSTVLRADFTRLLRRIRPANLNGELLVRAAKIKGLSGQPTAADATAGLGEDSFLLAAAGFSVVMFEHDPIIAALLRDALERAAAIPELSDAAGRMKLIEGDSITGLPHLAPPDVVLLDPMFPARRKSSLIKKKLQFIQRFEQPCSDEEALLNTAFAAHPRKIIIKRPLKGDFLAGKKPDYSLCGNSIRYDCFNTSVEH